MKCRKYAFNSLSRFLQNKMLGFVKENKFPKWPAELQTVTSTRYGVKLFGTGAVISVRKDNWSPFTVNLLARLEKGRRPKSGAFTAALAEIKIAADKEANAGVEAEDEKAKAATKRKNQTSSKKIPGRLTLSKQREENVRLFNKNIMYDRLKKKYRCRGCNMVTGYKYKAKSHAVFCSLRTKVSSKTKKILSCVLCPTTFPSKKTLNIHTKREHGTGNYTCTRCPAPKNNFASKFSFFRHLSRKHPLEGQTVPVYTCDKCKYKSDRKDTLARHKRKVHRAKQIKKTPPALDRMEQMLENPGAVEQEQMENRRNPVVKPQLCRYEILGLADDFQEDQVEVDELEVEAVIETIIVLEETVPAIVEIGADVMEAVPDTVEIEADVIEAVPGIVEIGAEEVVVAEDGGGDVGQRKKQCDQCDYSTNSSCNLSRHKFKLHTESDESYTCTHPWCSAVFDTLHEMVKHRMLCYLVCPRPECRGKTFKKFNKYERHMTAHVNRDNRDN